MDTLPPTGDMDGLELVYPTGATLEPRPGLVLADRYMLLEPIGRGASGWVWKAKHVMIGKLFAIKLLSTRSGGVDHEAAIRMLREANALSQVEHPNVTAVTDFGHARQGGVPFIVMELLQGEPLRAVLDARRLSWREARVWAVQILEGVEAAHEQGIVHRDIKAANLFVTEKGSRIKVLDFGLARTRHSGEFEADRATGRLELGEVFGTPATMSPEQIAGGDVDARSDLYSLGCVLYEMLAGRPPVQGRPAELLYQHVYGSPVPLRELAHPEVPDAVCAMVDRCLRKAPDERPASVSVVREVFDRRKVRRVVAAAAASQPESPAPWRRRAAGAVVAVGALLGLVAASRPAPPEPIATVELRVPAMAVASDSPNLHAELPVLELARPKQRARPQQTTVVATARPRRPSAAAPRSPQPAPTPQPATEQPEPKRRAAPADPHNAQLKNPFAKP